MKWLNSQVGEWFHFCLKIVSKLSMTSAVNETEPWTRVCVPACWYLCIVVGCLWLSLWYQGLLQTIMVVSCLEYDCNDSCLLKSSFRQTNKDISSCGSQCSDIYLEEALSRETCWLLTNTCRGKVVSKYLEVYSGSYYSSAILWWHGNLVATFIQTARDIW